jgi:hypothetical protein
LQAAVEQLVSIRTPAVEQAVFLLSHLNLCQVIKL